MQIDILGVETISSLTVGKGIASSTTAVSSTSNACENLGLLLKICRKQCHCLLRNSKVKIQDIWLRLFSILSVMASSDGFGMTNRPTLDFNRDKPAAQKKNCRVPSLSVCVVMHRRRHTFTSRAHAEADELNAWKNSRLACFYSDSTVYCVRRKRKL